MKRTQVAGVAVLVVLLLAGLAATGGLRRFEPVHTADASQLRMPAPLAAPVAPTPKLVVAFRLDPELTRGMFMGDRWVTPPTYFFAQEGSRFVVQAKPQQVGSRGEHIDLSGDWSVGDPAMVAVTPGAAGEVTLVIGQPGQTRVTVATGAGSKVLDVNARRVDNGMQVRITQ